MKKTYNPADVEASAQQFWSENQCFEVGEDLSKENFYCLSMLPYPSGELHMGHVRNYAIGDGIARYQRQQGKNVLQPMGWDAFGLPAENAAIQHKLPPAEWTQKNIKKMRKQLKQLGLAIDWSRELATCTPEYYRWEQWLFLKLYKAGLAYQKDSVVNWDPVDQTVLANEQVVNGKGWRSGAPVERRNISQWFLRITDYADELLEGLDTLTGWPEQVRAMQRHWIGRSEGVEIQFKVKGEKEKLSVFTTRADTLMGVTYLAIAAEHPLADQAAKNNKAVAQFVKQCKQGKVAEADIATQEKKGIFSGFYANHPLTKKPLPVWIANFVLMEYGSGAVMSVPGHDERDFAFAKQYDLPIKQVITPLDKTDWDIEKSPYMEYGKLMNSSEFDGLTSEKAIKKITEALRDKKAGETKTHYRLRDWGISRQRYWGTPIPIIYCKHCGTQPVPEEDLPVVLPEDIIPTGQGSPLATEKSFYKTTCPSCGKSARRETDTMDTFVESSWYYARYCCNDQDQVMLDDRAKYWTPVDQYVGGIEHAVMHLLYARFMHRVLRDQGLFNTDEPFTRLLTQGMVLKDGYKMSKSKGNVVAPPPLIKTYGADTARLFMIFAAPPEQDLEWSDSGIEGAFRFLKKLWTFSASVEESVKGINEFNGDLPSIDGDTEAQAARKLCHDLLYQADQDMQRSQLNTVVSAAMKMLNTLVKLDPALETHQLVIQEGLSILLRILHPITPHITHELWHTLGFGTDILEAHWPKVSAKARQSSALDLIVQINGKLRAKIQVPADASEDTIKNTALNDENVQRHLMGKQIKKTIVVPKRLINLVI